MNKKGSIGYVSLVIMGLLLIILVTSLVIPQVKNTTTAQPYSENLARTTAPAFENDTLTKATAGLTLESGSLSITGLTVTTNYTVDYDTGIVTFNNVTANGTYAASYNYYESNYLNTTTERTLMGVVVIAVILGVIVFLFRGFGVMGGG